MDFEAIGDWLLMRRVSIGEIELNVVERGTGEPLLLVHGFPLDHSMWQGQIDGLSARYRVIAPDLRGFGKSDVTSGAVTMEQLADDLALLLDALGVTGPVNFCGLSMGGYVAWQFAARHGKRLKRLIVCDTRAVADSKETAEGREKSAQKALAEGPKVVADAMLPKLFHGEGRQPYREATYQVMLATDRQGVAAALRGMAKRPDVTSRLQEIAVPTLVLCGEHDVISPPAEMRAIAEGIPGSQYVEIKDAGHMAPLEKPAEVNAAIEKFLSRG
jgi:3-oxoadipate enol-lactonase